MSTIRARCGSCATAVGIESDRVVFAVGDGSDGDTQAEVLFACPACGRACLQLLPRPLAVVLVRQGATCLPRVAGSGLAPRDYPERRPECAVPFHRDDLLALHELLQTDSWFDVLREAEERRG